MNKADLVRALASLSPEDLVEVFRGVANGFSARATTLYEGNPEENGMLAQPYADLSDLMEEASMVFESKTEVLPTSEAGDIFTDTAEGTVTPVLTASVTTTAKRTGSPWGNR